MKRRDSSASVRTARSPPSRETAAARPATIWEAAARGRTADVQRQLALLASQRAPRERNAVDVRDAGGWTPLLHAAFQGRATVARFLLERGGADPDARDASALQRTPLLEAAARGHVRVVRALLSSAAPRASVDAQDARGCSALMLAAWHGHLDVARELLACGARVDVRDRDAWTALAFAARFGRLEVARLLLGHGAERDAASAAEARTPLLHAVLMGHTELARLLLESGADASRTDCNGDSAVLLALEGDSRLAGAEEEAARLDMVRLLVEHGASPAAAGAGGQTPLEVAESEGLARIAAFLALCVPAKQTDEPLAESPSDFFEAIKTGDVPSVLDRVDAMLHARDADGRTPLMLAALHDQLDVLQLCLSRGANVASRDDATASGALHFAARAGSPRAVALLLSEGADVAMKDARGLTPMDVAAAFGHAHIVEELFAGGASVRNVSKIDRQTIWHRAVVADSVDVVRFLVGLSQRGSDDPTAPPDVNALNRRGYSALHMAAGAGSSAIVALLLAAGADPNAMSSVRASRKKSVSSRAARETEEEPTPEDNAGDSTESDGNAVGGGVSSLAARREAALHLAVAGGHRDVVELLLRQLGKSEGRAGVDIRDHKGRTPLLIAATRGHADIAILLLDAGADVEAAASDQGCTEDAGRTSLLLASLYGREALVKTLLEYGARVDVTSASGETPIGVAPTEELRGVLELYRSSQEFHQRCFAVLHGADDASSTESDANGDSEAIAVTSEELLELAGLVTSAYDLRFLMTISLHILDDSSIKNQPSAAVEVGVAAALKRAFQLILAKKLVYDNDACVFFRLALDQCFKRKLVSARDHMRWKLEATKVTMESADWVVDLKRQVYENSCSVQTCAKNVNLLANGIKHVHAMAVANRDGVLACANKLHSLEARLQDANRMIAAAMEHMELQIMTNEANIRENRDRLTDVDGKLVQFQERLRANEANVKEVAGHLMKMQHAQIENMERQRKHQLVKHGFGLVASLVGFVFAPMLKEVFDTVLDLSDPLEIAKCAFSEALGAGSTEELEAGDVVDFLLTAAGDGTHGSDDSSDSEDEGLNAKALKPVLKSLLGKFGISRTEFTTVLRQEIVLQHPELVAEHKARGDLVVVGITDTDELHKVLANLEHQETDMSKMLDEMREYTQKIAVMKSQVSPSLSSTSTTPSLKPLTLDDSDSTRVPVLDLDATTTSDVEVADMDRDGNQITSNGVGCAPIDTGNDSNEENEDGISLTTQVIAAVPEEEERAAAYNEVEDTIQLMQDMALFPFHDAVVRSRGDVSVLKNVLQGASNLSAFDPNASMTMDMVTYSTPSRTSLSAAEYAYCLGYDAVGDLLGSMISGDETSLDHFRSTSGATLSVEVEDDLDEFPYHYAVSKSRGDIEECELYLEVAQEDGDPIDARVFAWVRREVRRSSTTMSAVEFACHLGYVDVVTHFLLRLRVKTATKRVVLLGRASEQAEKKPPRVVMAPVNVE